MCDCCNRPVVCPADCAIWAQVQVLTHQHQPEHSRLFVVRLLRYDLVTFGVPTHSVGLLGDGQSISRCPFGYKRTQCTHIHPYIHAYTHRPTHIYIHTHIHVHTLIHTRTRCVDQRAGAGRDPSPCPVDGVLS